MKPHPRPKKVKWKFQRNCKEFQEMLKNNILASNSVYCCTQHNDNIIDKYFNSLDKVFKMIKSCEDGSEIDKYLKTKISIKGFQRLN